MRNRREKHKLPPFPHSGILLVDKPLEWTSHDVVNFIRRRFNIKKVGHCGTLDPAATGLLVIVLGHATKMSAELSKSDKSYRGTMLLGVETDSQDMQGKVVAEHDPSEVTEALIRAEVANFTGELQQIPPMFSAVKKDGKKLYELAREGKVIVREPRDIIINSFEITDIDFPKVNFEVSCSKGTYVRTLCHDIGRNLGCGGTLFSLTRTRSGEFSLDDAHQIEEIKEWEQDNLYRSLTGF